MRSRSRPSRGKRRFTAKVVTLAAAMTAAVGTTLGGLPGIQSASAAPVPSAGTGIPAHIHALGNDHSATVTWTGPTDVNGSPVTSWTVTSSTGQSVTARQPNHWAIVTGLANGTPVSFTVSATSSAGTSAVSMPSNAVRPEPIAPPSHVLLGKPKSVTYDQYSLMIGGKRVLLWAGEFDPWRTPSPSLWIDRLEEMKAAGFNAVAAYFNWDYTSPAPGQYNFSGVRDMNLFLNDAQKVGLYVIARPGPYINAETDGGGFPGWLDTQSGTARTDAPDYLAAADQWLSEIDPIIAAHQITRGGDVILYQVENELRQANGPAVTYMTDLVKKVRADGINVPLVNNSSPAFQGGSVGLDLTGSDVYPQGFNCTNTSALGNPPGNYLHISGTPKALTEFQGGSFDYFGSGFSYQQCQQLTGSSFENIDYKSNLAQGVTIQNLYMAVGGTNWGWLPATSIYPNTATGFTSYDYGAAIAESGQLPAKYRALKLIGEMTHAVAPLAETSPATAPAPSNSGVTALERVNPVTGTKFLYLRQANASSTATVTTTASFSAGSPVPAQGQITLRGREAKLLIADWKFGHQDLVYSTSEVATQTKIPGGRTLLVYGDAGTSGETVLHYAGAPVVKVLSGSVHSTWDAATGDLRLDYMHQGLAEVKIAQGGHTLLLLIGTHTTAEQFWTMSTASGRVLVQGGDLLRTAAVSAARQPGQGALVALTGDTKASGTIRVWAPDPIGTATWNGRQLRLTRGPDGSVTASVAGPPAIHLPALASWRFSYGSPERLASYNDSSWPIANHYSTTNPTKPVTLPVLFADDYGFHHGFIWYRGSFTGSSPVSGITLTGDGGAAGAFSVWLNGVFLGSNTAGREQTQTFSFPAGAIRPGKANVVSVLVENMGHQEDCCTGDTQKRPRGLLGASLTVTPGTTAPAVTWRLEGNKGGTSLQDPVRGVMNASGLYGSNHGWNLPGYPAGSWTKTTLPSSWAKQGLPPGVGWYRTSFSLHLPRGTWVPMALHMSPIHGGSPGQGKGTWQAIIYLNGWMIGHYVNYLGPQQNFYLPQGILRADGHNTLSIAVWGLTPGAGGLGKVSLTPYTVREGGVPVAAVDSPGFRAATYGRPVRPANPVLGVSASATTVRPGPHDTLSVTATLTNSGASALTRPRVALTLPAGWSAQPAGTRIGTLPPGRSGHVTFTVTPPASPVPGTSTVLATATFGGDRAGTRSVQGAATLTVPEPVQATFAPGSALATSGKVSSTLTLANEWNEPLSVAWKPQAPSGVTVSPDGTTASLAAGASASTAVSVTLPSASPQGQVQVTAAVSATVAGVMRPSGSATLTIGVPYPSLSAAFDNVGISTEADASAANFDGSSYSFPESQLTAAGFAPGAKVTVGGIPFTWPDVPADQPDNVLSYGQTIRVSGSGSTLGFLEASGGVNGPAPSGTGTVYYSDGTTQSFSIAFGNYFYPPTGGAAGNSVAVSVGHLDNPSGTLTHTSVIYLVSVPIDPGKTVTAVTLPTITNVVAHGSGSSHVFAVGIGG